MVNSDAPDDERPLLTVYYDGGCPICAREIGMYRTCRGADRIAWVDADAARGNTLAPGLSRDEALGRFHVIDRSGRALSGGAAFSALWRALPAFSILGRILSCRPFSIMLEGIYRLFLILRPRLKHLFQMRPERN